RLTGGIRDRDRRRRRGSPQLAGRLRRRLICRRGGARRVGARAGCVTGCGRRGYGGQGQQRCEECQRCHRICRFVNVGIVLVTACALGQFLEASVYFYACACAGEIDRRDGRGQRFERQDGVERSRRLLRRDRGGGSADGGIGGRRCGSNHGFRSLAAARCCDSSSLSCWSRRLAARDSSPCQRSARVSTTCARCAASRQCERSASSAPCARTTSSRCCARASPSLARKVWKSRMPTTSTPPPARDLKPASYSLRYFSIAASFCCISTRWRSA